jgi:hypothetical protein
MTADYNEIIQRAIQPRLIDTTYTRAMEPLTNTFGTKESLVGDRITERFRAAWSSNSAAYTKADVNPTPASQTLIKPYWTKTFYHGAAEIEGIDISNARGRGDIYVYNLVNDAVMREGKSLMDVVVQAQYSELKADVDATSTYSDGALSRTTYTTLASYEEGTDTAITVALFRGMVDGSRLLKNSGPKSGFVSLMEEAVYNKFRPLAAALHTFEMANEGLQALGYPECGRFEGTDIVVPDGMTTGDVLYLRKEDVNIYEHRPLEVEEVESGRDSVKVVLRVGVNTTVVNPGFQGKMTSKD